MSTLKPMTSFIFDPAIGMYFFLLLGLAMGSFANVVIDRLPKGISLSGRSHCDSCGKLLTIFELVPVFSWLVLRGRCMKCKAWIPVRFTVVEFSMALLFWAALAFVQFSFLPALALSVALWTMVVIAVIDKETHMIPDALTGLLAISLLLFQFLIGEFSFLPALIGLLFFGLQWAISRGRWVGSGDIFLAGALGLLLPSWEYAVIMLMSAYIAGAIIAAALLLSKRIDRKAHVPFGPFLILGALIAFFMGGQILSMMFPYA